jgi:hypothetical protein
MKANTKYDYEALHDEFVQGGEISIRGLAEKHGIKTWSALHVQAAKHDWRGDRERYQRSLTEKTLEKTSSVIAGKRATITVDALDVIHAAIFKMAADMQDHWVQDPENPRSRVFVPGIVITPDSLSKLLDRLLTLTGSASVITESRNIDLTPDLPPDIARLIADVAASRGSATRPMGQAALPSRREPN